MTTNPSDIVTQVEGHIGSYMRLCDALGLDPIGYDSTHVQTLAFDEIIRLNAALAAETERCARVADAVAKTAREEAALFSAKGDYTEANHYSGYADGCEEVAAAIRAGG